MAASRAVLPAHADETSAGLAVRPIAEIETRVSRDGSDEVKLVAADRVVRGDQIVYSLEIRNTRAATLAAPVVTYPVPDHMSLIANSAAGPGAEISYSVDGGRTFNRPENLKVAGPKGDLHTATAADYTHIRWQLKHPLNSNATAFARFRALVK